jgi:hypothetical protein
MLGALRRHPAPFYRSAPRGLTRSDPSRSRRCQDGSAWAPPRTILLISAPRADAIRCLKESQMQRWEHLAATQHGPTDQRFEA